MAYQTIPNPWDIANNPPPPVQEYWGQISMEAQTVILVKGVGKMPYVPGQVNANGSETRPVVALKIAVTAIPEMGLQYPEILREPLGTATSNWGKITLPSLRDIGIMQAETINGKYARVELVDTGDTYDKKDSAGNVTKKAKTAFKFVAIFDTEQACKSDYFQVKGGTPEPAQQPAPWNNTPPPTNGNGNGNGAGGDKERETATKFLKPYIAKAVATGGGDLEKTRQAMAQLIASQPLLSKHFTVDSPEVIDALSVEMLK